LLVEAFPAAQLWHWELPHQKYNGHDQAARERREQIAGELEGRVAIPDDKMARIIHESADALDAVLCAFAAIAVTRGRVAYPPEPASEQEGWISVHR
jgi:hypothetical protein